MVQVTSLATSALIGAVITATSFMILNESPSASHIELAQAQSEIQRYKTEIETLKTALDASKKQVQATAAREAAVVTQTRPAASTEGTSVPTGTPSDVDKNREISKTVAPPPSNGTRLTTLRMGTMQTTDEWGNEATVHDFNNSRDLIKTHLQKSIDLTDYEWEQLDAILREKEDASTLLFTDGEPAEEFQKRVQAMSEPGADPALKLEMETKMIQRLGSNLAKIQALENESNQKIRNLLGDTRYEEYRKTPLVSGSIRFATSTNR
ncbi:MAG: hypothetical protein AB7F75_06170 [Planctomycetota bacterium]